MRTKTDKLFLSAVTITALAIVVLVANNFGRGVFAQQSADPVLRGNVLYMQPQRIYLDCAGCEDIRLGENSDGVYIDGVVYVAPLIEDDPTIEPTQEPATLTPMPTATAVATEMPLPTATLEPTLIPTDEPTATPVVDNGCIDMSTASASADYENYIGRNTATWSLNFDALQNGAENPGDVSNPNMVGYEDAYLGLVPFVAQTNNEPLPVDSDHYIEWCFTPNRSGRYHLIATTYTQGNNSDSFWLKTSNDLDFSHRIKLPERQFSILPVRPQWGANSGPAIGFDLIKSEDFYVRVFTREDGAHLYRLELVPAGGQPVTPVPTQTAVPPTPRPVETPQPYGGPPEGYP